MTTDQLLQVAMWLVGGLVMGIAILIAAIVRLTLDVRELNTTLKHQDLSIVAVREDLVEHKKDTKENFEQVWEHARDSDKSVGELDRRVTRLEPKGAG